MSRRLPSMLAAILATVALLAPCVPASAGGSALFRGRIVDLSGAAIKRVTVVLTSAEDPTIRLKVRSDTNGQFEIAVEDASLSYGARFERSGYVGMSAAIELSEGETNEYTFTMLTQQEIAEGKAEALPEREQAAEFTALGLYNDGVTALTNGDLVTARQRLESALEHDHTMPQALSALCLITMQQQEWSAALEYATRTLAIEPTDLRALFASYRANGILGNTAEAAAAAEALKSAGYNDEVAGQIFNEGVDLYREKKVEEATTLFELAADLDPTMVNAHVVLAGLYLDNGAFDKALAASDRALALLPGDKKALRYRFETCLRSGNDHLLPGAIEAMSAIDLPYVSKVVNERAFNLFGRNLFDQSKKLVGQLLDLDPKDARANYVMGLILVRAGDTEAGLKHLQAFVEAAPDDPDAATARTMMEAIR